MVADLAVAHLDERFGHVEGQVAVVCALFVSFTYVAGQMRGVGVVFSRFLEVEVDTGVYIVGALAQLLERADDRGDGPGEQLSPNTLANCGIGYQKGIAFNSGQRNVQRGRNEGL